MTLYPKLGTMSYEDKYLDIKIVLRAKKIILKEYLCEGCELQGSLLQWQKEFASVAKRNKQTMITSSEYFNGQRVYDGSTVNGELVCPNCKKILVEKKKELIKVYANNYHYFINFDKLIRTLFRTMLLRTVQNPFSHKPDARIFYDDLEDVRKDLLRLEEINKGYLRNEYGAKITFTPEKKVLTKEMLDKSYREYIKRKVTRAI